MSGLPVKDKKHKPISVAAATKRRRKVALEMDGMLTSRTISFREAATCLTAPQRMITSEIRRCHRRGEPLNITAVKRRHPELMEAVYAIRPFWGWKRALAAAGLSYADINVQLEELVECLICGKKFRILTLHLMRAHEITTDDYRSDYPEAEYLSEEVRAAKTGWFSLRNRPSRKLIKHWEPLYTPEYVLDRVAEYYIRGYSLNLNAMQTQDKSLLSIALKYFSSWDNMLKRIGLDPARIRHAFPSPYQNRGQIIKAIRDRWRDHLPLHAIGIRTGKTANDTLYYSVSQIFGSWRSAIEAAGLDYELINRQQSPARRRLLPAGDARGTTARENKPYTLGPPTRHPLWLPLSHLSPRDVLRVIRKRKNDGLPMTSTSLQKGPYTDTRLFKIARHFFGSWHKAAMAAGIPEKEINRPRPIMFPTPASVIDEIKQRKEQGLPLNAMALELGPCRNTTLIGSARKYFRSWQTAIEAAGLAYDTIKLPFRKPKYATPLAVIKRIQARRRQNLPLNLAALQKAPSQDQALYRKARAFFGSWQAAIEASGYSYDTIVKKRISRVVPERD